MSVMVTNSIQLLSIDLNKIHKLKNFAKVTIYAQIFDMRYYNILSA